MSERELIWLANSASKSKLIVEFGSFCGRSTRALADNTDGVIYAVDPWNGDYPMDDGSPMAGVNTFALPTFVANLKDHVNSKKVIPCRTFSDLFNLPAGLKADMVFIDGDHRYEPVKKDIHKALELLKPGGIISGHDYSDGFVGVIKAVNELLDETNREDTIWWTLK